MTRRRRIAAALRPPGTRLLAVALLCGTLAGYGVTAVAQPKEVLFDLKIENRRLPPQMRTIRVKQGDAVKLHWMSDRPITLHLHGYDIETRVEPGTVAIMSFTARVTGRFPVEEHTSDGRAGHSEAPLARVEVHPR